MGKATILAGLGKGLYSANVERKHERIDARIAEIDKRLAEIPQKILDQQAVILTNENDLEAAQSALTALVLAGAPEYNGGSYSWERDQKEQSKIDAQIKVVAKLQTKVEEANRQVSALNLEKAELLSEKDRLSKAPKTAAKEIWCADYSAGLTGTVATLDLIGGETIILPGYKDNKGNVYDYKLHGILDPLYESGPASSFYAAAMEPGWRKWTPFYRTGTITARVGNTAQIALDACPADFNGALGCNQTTTLADVPISYMGVNGAIFLVGDHVVIQFHNKDWTQRTVIGFVDHPRPPGWVENFDGLIYNLGDNDPAKWPAEWKGGGGWNAITNSYDLRWWFWNFAGNTGNGITWNPAYEEWWTYSQPTQDEYGIDFGYAARTPHYRYGMTRDMHKICYWQDCAFTGNGMLVRDQILLFPGDCTGLLVGGSPVSDSVIPSDYTHLVIDYTIEAGWNPAEPWAHANSGFVILHNSHHALISSPYYGYAGGNWYFSDSLQPAAYPNAHLIQLFSRDPYADVLNDVPFDFNSPIRYTGTGQSIVHPNGRNSDYAYLFGSNNQKSFWKFPRTGSYVSQKVHEELVIDRLAMGLPVPYAIEIVAPYGVSGSAETKNTWTIHSIRFETRT